MSGYDAELDFLFMALAEPLGVIIRAENGEAGLRRLNIARRSNPALHRVQIRRSPDDPEHEFWLVRGYERVGGEKAPSNEATSSEESKS